MTAIAVRPLADRHGLRSSPKAELVAAGRKAAEAQAGIPWPQLVALMTEDCGADVEEFEPARRLAPADDRTAFEILIDHEVAAVEFARRQVAGDLDSTSPPTAYRTTRLAA